MAKVDLIQKRFERKGWKFQFVHSTATQHLSKAPVIASKGNTVIRGTSLTNVFKKIY
jgi:hypothetical protein